MSNKKEEVWKGNKFPFLGSEGFISVSATTTLSLKGVTDKTLERFLYAIKSTERISKLFYIVKKTVQLHIFSIIYVTCRSIMKTHSHQVYCQLLRLGSMFLSLFEVTALT